MLTNPNDATCYIYGGRMVQSLSGLSKVYPSYVVLSNAKKLRTIELGSDEPGYYNGLQKKWVDVTILGNNLEATLKQLRRLGFSGSWVLCYTEDADGNKLSDEVFFEI